MPCKSWQVVPPPEGQRHTLLSMPPDTTLPSAVCVTQVTHLSVYREGSEKFVSSSQETQTSRFNCAPRTQMYMRRYSLRMATLLCVQGATQSSCVNINPVQGMVAAPNDGFPCCPVNARTKAWAV